MYKNFGFTENIFNTKSLLPCREDLNKFIGRGQDIKRFAVDISSTDSAVTVVTGHRGVGKTSFVNIMEYAVGFERDFVRKHIPADIPYLIPCYHKIQIESDDNIRSVLLKSLSSILFSIERFAEESKKQKMPKQIKDLIKWVSDTFSTARGGSVSFGGFGGGLNISKQHKNVSEVPVTVLQNKIHQVVNLAVKSFKTNGIFLNINNVDILEEKFFCNIFNQLRDYLFDIKGLWSVIIGQPGLYSSLYQQAARVSEIISGQETKLDPLTEEDLISALKVRQKIYSTKPKKLSSLPIEEGFIREIYKHSDGEIRPALKVCDDILRSVFSKNPHIKKVTEAVGKPVLKNILTQQLSLDSLKAKDRQILHDTLREGSLRPKDYKKLKLKSAVDFTNKTRPLISKKLLKKEVKGNTAKYMVTGVVHLAKYVGVTV